MIALGNLIGFATAIFMDFRMQAVCALLIPIIFVLSFSFVPETPVFLYKKQEIEVNAFRFDLNKAFNFCFLLAWECFVEILQRPKCIGKTG